jgi:hypothetical protein
MELVQFAFADEFKRACRYCATIALINLKNVPQRWLTPHATEDTATVTFIRFKDRTYAVTAWHVIDSFRRLAARDNQKTKTMFYRPAKVLSLDHLYQGSAELASCHS